jgi:hypothetical protein
MRLAGYGLSRDPQPRPPYFTLDVCSRDGDRDVTITEVRGRVRGTREPVRFEVAFEDVEAAETMAAMQPLPDGFAAAPGAHGRLPECGSAGDTRPATLAVVFPPVHDQPVVVDRVTVSYVDS